MFRIIIYNIYRLLTKIRMQTGSHVYNPAVPVDSPFLWCPAFVVLLYVVTVTAGCYAHMFGHHGYGSMPTIIMIVAVHCLFGHCGKWIMLCNNNDSCHALLFGHHGNCIMPIAKQPVKF